MRILVLGAGGPAGVNTGRALAAAGHDVFGLDANPAHLTWLEAIGVTTGFCPDDIDVLMPQPDVAVWRTAHGDHDDIAGARFLPTLETIETCQDKSAAAAIWHEAGLRGPALPIVEPYPDMLHARNDQLGNPFWLRVTRGAGANKAIKVADLREGYHWIRFWESRDVYVDWIAEPYLSGRDIAWTSIWYHGELVTSFARERVEYLYPNLTPEGLTGTPTIARVIHDDQVTAMGTAAVVAIDRRAHGIFSVDLREDADGVPRPTEINAGRGFTTMGLWSLAGDVNFTALAAELALADTGDRNIVDPLPEGLTLSRHIDCGHVFTNALVAA